MYPRSVLLTASRGRYALLLSGSRIPYTSMIGPDLALSLAMTGDNERDGSDGVVEMF